MTLVLEQDGVETPADVTSALVPVGMTTFVYRSSQRLQIGEQLECKFTVCCVVQMYCM